uniref:Pan3 C-terminal knob domain-containing protein n=1 Tax=Trichobilharzia regenti TaxID=157069 RepID=A0AA85KMV5_TRIRE|nr:unnamed protein product [Trichobilharzia regenti]
MAMTSNYVYGGSGIQNSNMLSYTLKNLSLGPNQVSQISDQNTSSLSMVPSTAQLTFARSVPGSSAESVLRQPSSRPTGIPDFLTLNSGSVSNRPSVLSTVSVSKASSLTPQNGHPTKAPERVALTPKAVVPANHGFANMFRHRIPGVPSSRMVSNLPDGRQVPLSSDMCPTFWSGRFSGTTTNNLSGEGINNSNVNQSNSSAFDNMLASPHSFGNYLPPTLRPPTQLTQPYMQNSSIPSLNFCQAEAALPPEIQPDIHLTAYSESHCVIPITASQYYSSHQSENTKKLQACGGLRTPSWILVPPVPEDIASHMRTGRIHEFKSNLLNNRNSSFITIDDDLKRVLRNKLEACLLTVDEATKEKLPRSLGPYTDIVPLEVIDQPRASVTFGLPGVCFKAWSPRFNSHVLLRRIVLPPEHGTTLAPDAYYLAKHLSELNHSSIVGFRDVFFTDAFSDNYAPTDLGMPQESVLWSYLVQLTSALRFIHQTVRRSCGILDPTKVLLQDGPRLKINCFGLKDILFYSAQDVNLLENQAADFIQLGKLMLGVACGTVAAVQASQRISSFNLMQRAYRPELVTLIRSLVSGQITGADQLMRATAPFAFDHLTRLYDHSDLLESQLLSELGCDRLFRLICKLQSIVERCDQGISPEWSETGDRYMLKLFRDFVFHQSDPLGAPYLDLAHIITTLNKVEAGSLERLCLVSRDSQNVIIVTYADIKQWLDTSFSYLVEKHRQSRCELHLAQQRHAPPAPAAAPPPPPAQHHHHQQQQEQQQDITSVPTVSET